MSLRFSLLSSRNFAIIINASRLFVSPCHHQFLAFQLGSHDTHQHYLFIATSSDPVMARSPVHISLQISDLRACGRRPQSRIMIGSPSRIRSRRWSGCSGGTYRHGSAGAIVCTSARSSASSCWAPSASALATASRGCRWVSVIDRIGGRRGWRSEPSIGSSVLNKMIVDDAYK